MSATATSVPADTGAPFNMMVPAAGSVVTMTDWKALPSTASWKPNASFVSTTASRVARSKA